MREAISGNQWQSELRPELSREHLRAMREAISGNQRPSSGSGRRDEHLVWRKDEGRPAGGRNELCHRKGLPCARGTFKDETWWSHLHALREAISGNQWHSVAISGNQWTDLGRREGRSEALDHSSLLVGRGPGRTELKRPMGAQVVAPDETLNRLSLCLSRRLDGTRVGLFEGRERLGRERRRRRLEQRC